MKKITLSLVVSLVIIIYSSTITGQNFVNAINLGGSQGDDAAACFEDTQGSLYLSGSFQGTVDFDPGSGEVLVTAVASLDAYIVKYDEDMSFIWAITIGGNDQVNGKKIVVDGSGNVYTAGYFMGEADFDPSEGEYLLQAEDMDGYLAKYDVDGNFVWAFRIGSPESDIAFDVCLDPDGNIWVSGQFNAPVDFDPSGGTFILNDHGLQDAYVAKYSTDGSFIWAGGIGGETSLFYQPAMAIDNTGNLYLSCQFSGQADLDPGAGTYIVESDGSSDMFLLKLDQNGNFNWGFSLGGEMQDQTRDVYYSDGLILITGFYESTVDFDPSSGEAIMTPIGEADGFIAAYGTDGAYTWAKTIGGTHNASGLALADDDDHNIYVTGNFYGTSDFDPSAAIFELTAQGDWDIFTAKYDDAGNFLWANHAGGSENDYGSHIIVSNDQEKVTICGKFKGSGEFDHLGAGYILNANGSFDAFLSTYTTYSGAGVHEVNSDFTDILFYPNPVTDKLNISMASAGDDTQYRIINLLGAEFSTGPVHDGVNTIDVSNYAPGIYFIKIVKGSSSVVSKVLIE